MYAGAYSSTIIKFQSFFHLTRSVGFRKLRWRWIRHFYGFENRAPYNKYLKYLLISYELNKDIIRKPEVRAF